MNYTNGTAVPGGGVLDAAELLREHGDRIDTISRGILSATALMDERGAGAWDLRAVAVLSAALFYSIRLVLHRKRGVDWYPLAHALVSAGGSFAVAYLDFFSSETLAGVPEPLRSCQCHGPLTSLHRVVPAITMGYSLFDLVDGFGISVDFFLHGFFTLLVTWYFCQTVNTPQILAPMLVLEGSTPFLSVVRADFFTPTMALVTQLLFVVSFFAVRIVLVPAIWGNLMIQMWSQRDDEAFLSCFPKHFFASCFFFGMFFHLLNAFWFYKILKKIRRKINGTEGLRENNDYGEKAIRKNKENGDQRPAVTTTNGVATSNGVAGKHGATNGTSAESKKRD